jgi:hypothetical protein
MGTLDRRTLLAGAAGAGAALVLGGRLLEPARAAAPAGREVRRFVSRPDLIPPRVAAVRGSGPSAPGLLFTAPSSGPGQRGALIVDDTGEPVWFHPTVPKTVMNLRAALYHGRPVLTWWEGKSKHGLGVGEHVVFDRSYREIARFPAGGGLESDLHEFVLTPSGTALVTAYDIPIVDRSSVGHARGRVIEGVVQELEVPSARVLFEWRSLDHVQLTESYAQVAPAFDYFHVNSIDLADDDSLLVSARNTWAVYKIDRRTGKVIWRLGGKKSDFAMGKGTRFAWQHDARRVGDGLITLFDNAAAPQVEPRSRGLALALDEKRMRASLVRAYVHRPSLLAHALGSVQRQPNGNVLVGWGTEPYFTEYAGGGSVVLDLKLPRGGQNYRALRFPWSAVPAERPRLAARPAGSGHLLYASWNGATDVHAWHVLAGPQAGSLTSRQTAPRRGFETTIELAGGDAFAAVVPLDRAGRAHARSNVVSL